MPHKACSSHAHLSISTGSIEGANYNGNITAYWKCNYCNLKLLPEQFSSARDCTHYSGGLLMKSSLIICMCKDAPIQAMMKMQQRVVMKKTPTAAKHNKQLHKHDVIGQLRRLSNQLRRKLLLLTRPHILQTLVRTLSQEKSSLVWTLLHTNCTNNFQRCSASNGINMLPVHTANITAIYWWCVYTAKITETYLWCVGYIIKKVPKVTESVSGPKATESVSGSKVRFKKHADRGWCRNHVHEATKMSVPR